MTTQWSILESCRTSAGKSSNPNPFSLCYAANWLSAWSTLLLESAVLIKYFLRLFAVRKRKRKLMAEERQIRTTDVTVLLRSNRLRTSQETALPGSTVLAAARVKSVPTQGNSSKSHCIKAPHDFGRIRNKKKTSQEIRTVCLL